MRLDATVFKLGLTLGIVERLMPSIRELLPSRIAVKQVESSTIGSLANRQSCYRTNQVPIHTMNRVTGRLDARAYDGPRNDWRTVYFWRAGFHETP
jgi:hypothetical protein